jgi:hypothetical protein
MNACLMARVMWCRAPAVAVVEYFGNVEQVCAAHLPHVQNAGARLVSMLAVVPLETPEKKCECGVKFSGGNHSDWCAVRKGET